MWTKRKRGPISRTEKRAKGTPKISKKRRNKMIRDLKVTKKED